MQTAEAARLAHEYTRQGGRTTLTGREYSGPLVVQKALYPEGDAVCHGIIVHPPGGIAAGDALRLELSLRDGAAALLTTPGAGKWYKSAGPQASLAQHFDLGRGAVLEWLPQPAIVFNAARAATRTEVRLHEDALYMGWDMTCMGRAAPGERFGSGELRQRTEVWQQDRRLWCEYARLAGDDPMLASAAGLNECTVSATLIAAGREIPKDLLEQCRGVVPQGLAGITALPRADVMEGVPEMIPKIEVDPETYKVKADGKLLECAPANASRLRKGAWCAWRRRPCAPRRGWARRKNSPVRAEGIGNTCTGNTCTREPRE